MFCVVLVFYGVAGHCIHTMATKGEIDLKRSLEFLPVRSSALGVIKRTAFKPKGRD
jgi:hypothetical protein